MGWNTGYRIFEQTVIGAYDLGKLDKDLLTVLMEPYRGTDIDSGGSCGMEAKDGKEVDQIIIETWGLPMPTPPTVAYDADHESWESFYEQRYDLMRQVTDHFGWR
jgi:hypothetical protein